MKINKSQKKKESHANIMKKGKANTSKNINKLDSKIKLDSKNSGGTDAMRYYKFL